MDVGSAGTGDRRIGEGWKWAIASLSVMLTGVAARLFMAKVLFLQADEEIFSYDAYYFILGEPIDFIVRKIGAYIAYPFVLSLWFRLTGVSFIGARVFTVICWALVILFVFLTLKELTGDRRASIAGTSIFSLLPFPLRYGSMVLSEPMAWVFVACSFMMLVMAVRRKRWYLYAASGVVGVLASFSRRSALILFFIVVPYLLWTNRGSVSRALSSTASWFLGFVAPLAAFVGAFIASFGWDRLVEMGWASIPRFTKDFQLDVGDAGLIDNALYTLQPSMFKMGPVLLLLGMGLSVMYVSLLRDRWKGVFLMAVLYPMAVRIAFDTALDTVPMFALMAMPVLAVPLVRRRSLDDRHLLAIALLLSSSVAFSSFVLLGDIWNVIMYTSMAALGLIYLEDRVSGRTMTPVMVAGGAVLLSLIAMKEPQVEKLVLTVSSISVLCLCPMTIAARKRPGNLHLWFLVPGLLPAAVAPGSTTLAAGAFMAVLGVLCIAIVRDDRMFRTLKYPLASGAVVGIFIIPSWVPMWMVIAVVLYMAGASALTIRPGPDLGSVLPAAGLAIVSALVCLSYGSDIHQVLFAAVLVGSVVLVAGKAREATTLMRAKVGHDISLLCTMMVLGYLSFYVYYGWTEVYLTEFMVASAIAGGLFLSTLSGRTRDLSAGKGQTGGVPRQGIGGSKVISRMVKVSVPVTWRSAIVVVLLISSVVSVGSFLNDSWFREEGMDRRPYMRTIEEISAWVRDNSDEGEEVLVWHCYAVQADRETIIEVSNAKVYDGRKVVADMEEMGVDVFVLCWYTNHGIWEGQERFQEYILTNFHLDRVIDGNLCFLRNAE